MYVNENKKYGNNNLLSNISGSLAIYSSDFKTRSCNICNCTFVQNSRFDRYCEFCKVNDDLYKFADWAN
jgi:hypothetical protein